MLLAIVCGLVLCHCGMSSYVPIVKESFESNSSWAAWNCSRGTYPTDIVKRNSGSTPSTNTGPTGAADGTWYIYYEDSGNNGKVRCRSPTYMTPFPGGKCVASFNMSMYGSDMERLSFNETNTGAGISLWGNRGSGWDEAGFGFQTWTTGEFSFVLEMQGGTGAYEGDMAFDNLQVRCDDASSNRTTTPQPTTKQPTPPTTRSSRRRSRRSTTSSSRRRHSTTSQPTPSGGDGEVKVKFGGLDVAANVPAFEAVGDIDEVAEGIFYTLHDIMMYPFHLIHYIIHGY